MSIWEGTKDKEHLSDQDYLYLILFYLSGIIVSVMAYSYLSKQEEYIENETIYTKFLMQRLKEIQNTISLRKINGRIDQNWNQCPICLGNFNKKDNEISLPDCLHTFHESCLRKWICERPVCPCCRSDLRSKFQVPWEQTAY